jgi:serine/threonine protein kinase
MGNSSSGEGAYNITLTDEYRIGGGNYADVYKIQHKSSEKFYAAKFLKVPLSFLSSLEKMGYDRELEILKQNNHPFVIKY